MEPKELLKKLHPNQFSDSEIKEKVECPRELLDFYISRLSEQNKHFAFEDFIRKLLEREVCPNLIEETGPAGGGDGKVDTENYPVAESLQDLWLNGLNKDNDRWAFAISLKADWKSKCNSDINKIVDTKRGYTKIFFITNQSVKNDIREKYQDEKTKEKEVQITVFDKSWILDKALKIENIDLLKIIGIGQIIKEKQLGENDYKRIKRINEIEEKLKKYASNEIINQDVVDLAIETTMLSIENEDSSDIVNGKFQRALRLAKKKGNVIAERNIFYEISWYSHWRLNDKEQFEEYYEKYEQAISQDKKIEEIEKLVNLWTLAYTRNKKDKEKTKSKTETLLNLLEEKLESKSRVTYLRANTKLCIIRITLQEDVEQQFKKLVEIVEEAVNFKEYDFIELVKILEVLLPIYNNNEYYNQLYDIMTENLTEREGEVKRADMYLKKAKILSQDEKYYEAIKVIGKCLNLLYKEETIGKLIEAYINIGGNFEAIGLKYAAKNYYIAATAMLIDNIFRENDLPLISLKIVRELIDIEIGQGNIESAIRWLGILNILLNILIDKGKDADIQEQNEYIWQRDALISIEILKTKKKDFLYMEKIINLCKENELITSKVMAEYVIGIYDKELLEECENNEKIDEMIKEKYEASYKQNLPYPKYIDSKEHHYLESSLMGNKIKIYFKNTNLSNRFAEFILALLENTFATMYSYRTFMRGNIIIKLNETNTGTFDFNYKFDGIDTYTINLDSFNMYYISIEEQKKISEELYKMLINILAVNFIYDNFENTIKNMFESDKTFERALNHTNSIYNLNLIFGLEEEKECEKFDVIRENEWYANLNLKKEEKKNEFVNPYDGSKEIIYGKNEKEFFDNISQNSIYSSGMIQCNHWDLAKWKGIVYVQDRIYNSFVKIGFLFENEKGAKLVFQDLINYASKNDIDGKIILSIIKGINKEREFDYRIMITSKTEIPKGKEENILINSMARFQTMNCENNSNLKILENALKSNNNPKLSILPTIMEIDGSIKPLLDYEINIKEINIKEAYSIGKNNVESIAIMKEDNPIIPNGIVEAPIEELLKLKRQFE